MSSRGFTLIEVLVALAVLALTVLAILGTAARTTAAAEQVTTLTLAGWVADNELTRLRLAEEFPEPGSRSGTAELGGRQWRYTLTFVNTEDADLRRVEVVVRTEGEETVAATLVGFVPRTRVAAPPPAGTP